MKTNKASKKVKKTSGLNVELEKNDTNIEELLTSSAFYLNKDIGIKRRNYLVISLKPVFKLKFFKLKLLA